MDYIAAAEYVNSFINFENIPKYQYESSFKLERMEAMLKELGSPHKGLNVIHIAGSKGKGSTCAITAHILKEAGYRIGLYTSPHLMNFRERIRILDGLDKAQAGGQDADNFEGMISEERFDELVEKIEPVAENFRDHETLGRLSFFEILTACAFLYFKEKHVDAAVLETGLGGRLDATNAAMPLVCGITNISLEHTDKLGDTLGKIAHEKAGIIKGEIDGVGERFKVKGGMHAVVSAPQEEEVMNVIRKVCKEKNAKLYEVGKDIKYSILDSDENRQVFDLEGPGYHYKDLELSLIGSHQAENASLAIGMLKAMDREKFDIGESDIKQGLKTTVWPGRLQIMRRDPYIILDGAQNPASVSTLISSIKRIFRYKKLICVFGICCDKDIRGVSNILSASSDVIILTKAKDNPRALDLPSLRMNFRGSAPGLEDSSDVNEALDKAIRLADKDDLILVTGSLFVVGNAMEYF